MENVDVAIDAGVGSVNINLEQHGRRDQMARVARATCAEAMTCDGAKC